MLNSEKIVGIDMFDYIINQNLSEDILNKMSAINILQNVLSFDNQIEEIYTRVIYLNGKYLSCSTKSYKYLDDEKPIVEFQKEEKATIDDLKELLVNDEYSRKLLIATQIKEIEELKKQQTLKLK